MTKYFCGWKKFGLFWLVLNSLYISTAWADAPFITDDPGIMDYKSLDAIVYATGDKYKALTVLQAPALEIDYGIAPNFELDTYITVVNNFAIEHQMRSESGNATGLGDIDVELKYGLLNESEYIPKVSLVPNLFVPTGNSTRGLGNGRPYYTFPIAVLKTIHRFVTYAEFGYGLNKAPGSQNYFFGGCVVSHDVNDKLALGVEVYSQGGISHFIHAYTVLNLGTTYKITKEFSALFSFGHNIIGEEEWTTYLGISYG
jgi:hypothetical protein